MRFPAAAALSAVVATSLVAIPAAPAAAEPATRAAERRIDYTQWDTGDQWRTGNPFRRPSRAAAGC